MRGFPHKREKVREIEKRVSEREREKEREIERVSEKEYVFNSIHVLHTICAVCTYYDLVCNVNNVETYEGTVLQIFFLKNVSRVVCVVQMVDLYLTTPVSNNERKFIILTLRRVSPFDSVLHPFWQSFFFLFLLFRRIIIICIFLWIISAYGYVIKKVDELRDFSEIAISASLSSVLNRSSWE